MKNIDAIASHSIELTTKVWNTYAGWAANMAANSTNSRKYAIKTPPLERMVETITPQIYNYLNEDDSVDVSIKVQLVRSALLVLGHDECAKALRESVQSAGGKKMEEFKDLDSSNRQDRALMAVSNLAGYVVQTARNAHTAAQGLTNDGAARTSRSKP